MHKCLFIVESFDCLMEQDSMWSITWPETPLGKEANVICPGIGKCT